MNSLSNRSLVYITAAVPLVIGTYWLLSTYIHNKENDGDKRRKRKINQNKETTGIKRLGLTCYLNTALQVLASNDKFIEYLKNMDILLDNALKNNGGNDFNFEFLQIHFFLYDIIKRLQEGYESLYINISEIRRLERILGTNLLEQSDWLEILERIVDTLEKENLKIDTTRLSKNNNGDKKLPELPFYGTLSTRSYCSICKKTARPNSKLMVENERKNSILVDMTTQDEYKNDTFEQILTRSLCDVVQDYTCSYCSIKRKIDKKDNVSNITKGKFEKGNIYINDDDVIDIESLTRSDLIKTNLVKINKFVKYPETLIISLNRFKCNYNGQFIRVNNIYCDFPKFLNFNGHNYRLNNLVKHSGGVRTGGHYQVYKKKPLLIKNKYKSKETNKLELINYELKNRLVDVKNDLNSNDLSELKLVSSKEYDPFSKNVNDFWLVNDDKCKEVSLLYDINPYDSNNITSLVYEMIN